MASTHRDVVLVGREKRKRNASGLTADRRVLRLLFHNEVVHGVNKQTVCPVASYQNPFISDFPFF